MRLTRPPQPSSPGGRILLRLNPSKRVQFCSSVRVRRPESVSRPPICSQSISETHVSERHVGYRRRVEPSQRTTRASARASTRPPRNPQTARKMKTTTKLKCRNHAPTAQSPRAQPSHRILSLVNAACAARAGAAQMTLEDWRTLERELQRKLQFECHKSPA